MRIICPKCQFAREVPDDKIPSTAKMATCPKCKVRFNFRDNEPEEVEQAEAAEAETPPEPPRAEKPEGEVEINGVRRPIGKPWPTEPGRVPPEVEDIEVPPPEEDPRPKAEKEPEGDIWQRLESLGEAEERRSRQQEREESALGPRSQTGEVPWEVAEKIGFPKAAWLTARQVLFTPRRFFGSMPINRPIGRSLVYALFFFVFNGVANVMNLRYLIADPSTATVLAEHPEFRDALLGLLTPGGTVMLFGVTYAISVGFFLLTSLIVHLFLRLFGAGGSGLKQTMRVNAYAQTPMIFYLVPYFGQWLGTFWYLSVFAIGLKSIHRTNFARAGLALAAPLIILIGILLTIALASPA